jgi:hypothetical protein
LPNSFPSGRVQAIVPSSRVVLESVAVEVADDGDAEGSEREPVGQDRAVGAGQDPHRDSGLGIDVGWHVPVDQAWRQEVRPAVAVQVANRADETMVVLLGVDLPQQLLRRRAADEQAGRKESSHHRIFTHAATEGMSPELSANIM